MAEQPTFNSLKVAAFESRRADEMARLIEKLGGVPFVSPSMREVPLARNEAAVDFAHRLMTGQVDLVIFTTGVGFRHLLAAVEKHVDRERFLASLADITTVARGPKPVVAMKEVGLAPTIRVPEPNTWREVLSTLDREVKLANLSLALQEYGEPNPSLTAGLEARGARVETLRVYNWELPEETGPLAANVRRLAAGEIDVVLFTSAHQLVNLLRLAGELGLEHSVRRGLAGAVVASIGPTTSEMLRDQGLPVDIEPEHSKMGQLVVAAAEQCHGVRERKANRGGGGGGTGGEVRGAALDQNAAWNDSPFLRACRREAVPYTPVWLMRQAGRYMPEYRAVRAEHSFLELCKNPKLCSEVMCTAVARLGVDAAIIFSDLLPILEPMGMQLEFAKGDGPVIHNPLRTADDLARFRALDDLGPLDYVFETVSQTRADLPAKLPLIGFAGAPFTLASYAIEGGGSRNYLHTKGMMHRDAGAFHAIMERLTHSVIGYLNAQIAAGAQCVQIFDSWVGCLGPDDYRRHVLPHMQSLFAGLAPGVPAIHFGAGNPALLPLIAEGGGSVIGLDWRVRLDAGWQAAGHDRAVQGNLDPAALLADPATIREQAKAILDQAAGRPGHIFNLGHGVHQQTPVENAIALVESVHELSRAIGNDMDIDGVPNPPFLYGTAWKEEETRRLTELALEQGFRGIDTANQRKHYHEAAVGDGIQAAIARGLVTRGELFLQTKFTFRDGQDHRLPYDPAAPIATQVEQSFVSSLAHLHTDTIDSYILHGPSQRVGLGDSDWQAWRAMEAIHASGRARLLGVSNVSLEQLQHLCRDAGVPPRFVQNRCYASRGWDRRVREFCAARGITYQGFSLLTANGDALAHPALVEIAAARSRTPAQIIFRFALDVGMLPLTGTTDAAHMQADLAVLDFRLSAAEVQRIDWLIA